MINMIDISLSKGSFIETKVKKGGEYVTNFST